MPLHERKRNDAKRAIQAVALDLIEESGFQSVTMEQVAAEAQVGVATVYRYFGTKEQLVLWDEYDPLIFAAAIDAARGKTLLDSLSKALVGAVESVYATDAKRILRRARLMKAEPILRQTNAVSLAAMRDGFAHALLSSRACRNAFEAEIIAGAVTSAMETAVRHWEEARGKKPLGPMMRDAFRRLTRLTAKDPRKRQ